VAIAGLGALGGPTAARLKEHTPHEGWGLASRPATAEIHREAGLRVNWEGRPAPPVFLDGLAGQPAELPGGLDFLILATKTDALDELLPQLKPKLAPDGLLITYQNGYVIERVAAVIGREQTAAASVVWTASLRPDRSFRVSGGGHFLLGGLPEVNRARLHTAAELLGSIFPVERTDNIAGVLWSKMCVNACIGPVGAITGLNFGQQTADRRIRRLFMAVVTETLRVGRRHGIRFEKLNGRLDPVRISRLSPLPPAPIKHWIIRQVGKQFGAGESSMLHAIQRGKPRTEVHDINGLIAAYGRAYGIATPWHDRIIQMVSEIEAGKRPVDPRNLDDLLKVGP